MNQSTTPRKIEDATAAFSELRPEKNALFLAHFMHELTILTRDSYQVGGRGLMNPERVRAINEIQHRVAAQLTALLNGGRSGYPSEVLARIALESPDDSQLEQQLAFAFEHALSLVDGSR